MIGFHSKLYAAIFILLFPMLLLASSPADTLRIELVKTFNGESSNAGPLMNATAIDIDNSGNVYIIDRGKHRLIKFSPGGAVLEEVGGFGRSPEKFDDPRDVSASTTLDIFVADFNNDRVVRFDRNLNFLSSLTSEYDPPFDFQQVLSIAVSSQNELFVLDNAEKKIIKFSRFSQPVASFGGINEAYGQLLDPFQMTPDSGQRLFVSDPAQNAVVIFDYLGNYLNDLKHPEMLLPYGLYWGAGERLYVVDKSSNRLFVFSTALKFLGSIRLDVYLKGAVDVAVAYDKSNDRRTIYILTPEKCFVFEQK